MKPKDACACGKANSEEINLEHVAEIVDKHGGHRSALLAILNDIQEEYRYLPEETLRLVAERTGCSLVDIYGVATFYRSLSLEPKGKHSVCVCTGTACHVRGAASIAEEFEQQLSVRPGETTPDREFTLETMNCLGACALGPVVVVDGRYHSKVRRNRVRQLLKDARRSPDPGEIISDPRNFAIELVCHVCGKSLMDSSVMIDGCPSVCLTTVFNGVSGSIRLSSLYGSLHSRAEDNVPEGTSACFYCPHCDNELTSASECWSCQSPMVALSLDGGGTLYVCSRRGCNSRMLDLVDTTVFGGVPPVIIER